MKWISVKDKLPDYDQHVLLYNSGYDPHFMVVGWLDKYSKNFGFILLRDLRYITS